MPLKPEEILARRQDNRSFDVTAGGFVFVCRRPDRHDVALLHAEGKLTDLYEVATAWVLNWRCVTEKDLLPGQDASDSAVPFNSTLFRDWLADRPDLWEPIATACIKSHTDYYSKIENAVGESPAG
jgi:hypothetical protein